MLGVVRDGRTLSAAAPARPAGLDQTRWAWAAGSRLQALGEGWVAYGGASGETLYLNDESAAILEVLRDEGAASFDAVCRALAADSGLAPEELAPAAAEGWSLLVEAGLIRAVDAGG